MNIMRKYGFLHFLKLLAEYIGWLLRSAVAIQKPKFITEYISLRKELRKKTFPDLQTDNPAMAILRKGR